MTQAGKFAKLRESLVRALEISVMAIMALLVFDVVWQVFTRLASSIPQNFIVIKPSRWTDEVAVMLLIWVAMLGAAVAFVRKAHLGVDYFVGKLPGKYRKYIELVVYLIAAAFACVCMIYGGMNFVLGNVDQVSPAIEISMGAVYAAVPISGFFFLLVSIESFVDCVRHLRPGKPESEGGQA